MRDPVFKKYVATLDGKKIGSSVLTKEWTKDGVISQLSVDGCPLGRGEPEVMGWPGDHFEVVCSDGRKIHFYLMDEFESVGAGDRWLNCPKCFYPTSFMYRGMCGPCFLLEDRAKKTDVRMTEMMDE